MPVYDNLEVPLFLSLVHMLGRSDGEQTHHDAKHAGEQLGHLHKCIVRQSSFAGLMLASWPSERQSMSPTHSKLRYFVVSSFPP